MNIFRLILKGILFPIFLVGTISGMDRAAFMALARAAKVNAHATDEKTQRAKRALVATMDKKAFLTLARNAKANASAKANAAQKTPETKKALGAVQAAPTAAHSSPIKIISAQAELTVKPLSVEVISTRAEPAVKPLSVKVISARAEPVVKKLHPIKVIGARVMPAAKSSVVTVNPTDTPEVAPKIDEILKELHTYLKNVQVCIAAFFSATDTRKCMEHAQALKKHLDALEANVINKLKYVKHAGADKIKQLADALHKSQKLMYDAINQKFAIRPTLIKALLSVDSEAAKWKKKITDNYLPSFRAAFSGTDFKTLAETVNTGFNNLIKHGNELKQKRAAVVFALYNRCG